MRKPRNLTCDQLGVCKYLDCPSCNPILVPKTLGWMSGVLINLQAKQVNQKHRGNK